MNVMLESGLDIKPVITHHFPAREFRQGFEVMTTGNSGRVVLDWQRA
jgi:threonine 3-dehydrogenase